MTFQQCEYYASLINEPPETLMEMIKRRDEQLEKLRSLLPSNVITKGVEHLGRS